LIYVQNWKDEDLAEKEVKSCDNHDLGNIKEVDDSFITVRKGLRVAKVPKQVIGLFDGDKLYLRATEGEVLAGVYPFSIDREKIP
jgi:hypothetical protein